MQNTTNYNFLLPEGTDIVNPLTDMNPNWSSIDGIIKIVSDRTVTRASCTKSGSVYVIQRQIPVVAFRFTAPSDFEEGETFTLDGNAAAVKLPNGETPKSGTFASGVEVFALARTNTEIILYTSPNPYTPTAAEVSYDNTLSGLTANTAQAAIDEVVSDLNAVKGLAYIDITDNTDSVGRVTISSANVPDNNFKIIAAEVIDSHNGIYAVCTKRYAALDSTIGAVYFKNAADNTAFANTEITFRLWYADI